MNNLHFSEGGQPISLDDLKQTERQYQRGLALLAKLCGDGILDGCQSGGQINGNGTLAGITEGHVSLEESSMRLTERSYTSRGLVSQTSQKST